MIRKVLPWTAGAVAVTAAVGSVASSDTSSVWYRDLRSQSFSPRRRSSRWCGTFSTPTLP